MKIFENKKNARKTFNTENSELGGIELENQLIYMNLSVRDSFISELTKKIKVRVFEDDEKKFECITVDVFNGFFKLDAKFTGFNILIEDFIEPSLLSDILWKSLPAKVSDGGKLIINDPEFGLTEEQANNLDESVFLEYGCDKKTVLSEYSKFRKNISEEKIDNNSNFKHAPNSQTIKNIHELGILYELYKKNQELLKQKELGTLEKYREKEKVGVKEPWYDIPHSKYEKLLDLKELNIHRDWVQKQQENNYQENSDEYKFWSSNLKDMRSKNQNNVNYYEESYGDSYGNRFNRYCEESYGDSYGNRFNRFYD